MKKAHSSEHGHGGAFKTSEITYVRTWAVKSGKGVCLKGVHYDELTVSVEGNYYLSTNLHRLSSMAINK